MMNETMSIFSPQLAARFDALVEKYPVRRSALVPMLLYAQDEIGYLSDAVIAEVAERIGINELDVRNVATYYSMLRFKPAGRYNVQVCTNISCMLRGAYDLYERFQEELGIGHKGVTSDGLFSLEEVGHRIGITTLEVRNVATYYSMLRFKPVGKYNVQVCTNISCMLRGAYDLFDHLQNKLGIGHKGVTADGLFSLEEVECIGACCWAPAIQVNYDFHDDLTDDKVDEVLATYRAKGEAKNA